MRIAIDIRNVGRQRTGSEVVVSAITRRIVTLLEEGDDLYLITNTKELEVHKRIAKVLKCENLPNVHISYVPSGKRIWWMIWGVRTFLRQNQIEVFHTEYLVPLFIEKRTKVLTHIHDLSFCDQHIRRLIPFIDRFILDMLIPSSLSRANCIIAVSEFTKSEIVKYFPQHAGKVVIIFNAPQDATNDTSERDSATICRKYNLPSKYILAVGTMQPRKNIPFLIRSFAQVASKLPNIDLVLTGPESYNFDAEILEIMKDLDLEKRIYFTGYVDAGDLPTLYSLAEMFVSPSLYEGFGVPLLESATQGTLVACSEMPVYREIMQDGALYFDPNQIDQCTQSIYTGCTDPKKAALVVAIANKRLEQYSWDQSAKKFWEIIQSV